MLADYGTSGRWLSHYSQSRSQANADRPVEVTTRLWLFRLHVILPPCMVTATVVSPRTLSSAAIADKSSPLKAVRPGAWLCLY